MNWFIKKICKFWEINNRLPPTKVDLVVGMMLSLEKNGDVSLVLENIILNCVKYSKLSGCPIVFANRHTVNRHNVANQAKSKAVEYGIKKNDVIIPPKPEKLLRLRNTFEEIHFALRLLKFSRDKKRPKKLLIVANHLHMRRVLAASQILNKDNFNINIYWVNSHKQNKYGGNPAQIRFKYPFLFLIYEIIAFLYSKHKGWA